MAIYSQLLQISYENKVFTWGNHTEMAMGAREILGHDIYAVLWGISQFLQISYGNKGFTWGKHTKVATGNHLRYQISYENKGFTWGRHTKMATGVLQGIRFLHGGNIPRWPRVHVKI
ncbi:hypothetical protein BDR03DRAFT_986549 [Suillus americanus]|nr:hypothetical protein BDR03DRAFT_986549 [Suillus americanus]